MKNLTSGNVPAQLTSLALPMIAGNILQQFYNTMDAMVIGRYGGSAAFAAIGVAGTVMNLFIFVVNGFCSGISVILAGFYGRGDWKNFRREYFVSLAAGSIFTVSLSLAGLAGLSPLLRVIQTPEQVAGPARTYLIIIFLGLAASFLYNFCSAVLRAAGDTRAALVFLAAAVCFNLVLDLVLVAVLDLCIAGAAWATLISQLLSAALCLAYMRRKAPELIFTRTDMEVDLSLLKHTFRCCSATALRQSNLYIGKLLVQGSVNALGTSAIAAYTAAGRLEGFANSFGDSGGAAICVFLAQNSGDTHKKRACQGFAAGTILLTSLGALSSLLLFCLARPAAAFVLKGTGPEALPQCILYLRIISLFYTLCFMGNALAGYFDGHKRMLIPVIGATGHITLRVILAHILAPVYGLGAVAVAAGTGWAMVVLFWWILWFRGNHVKKPYRFQET